MSFSSSGVHAKPVDRSCAVYVWEFVASLACVCNTFIVLVATLIATLSLQAVAYAGGPERDMTTPQVFEAVSGWFLQRLDSHAVPQPREGEVLRKSCHDGAKAEKSTNQASMEPHDVFSADCYCIESLVSVGVCKHAWVCRLQ